MSKTNNKQFLESINFDELKTVEKGSYSGGRKHDGLYVNKQGRMFNFSDKKNEDVFGKHYSIKTGETDDGITFIAIKELTDKEATNKDFTASAKSTKTPFITVTKLCKDLFGNDKSDWMHNFESQGETKDGLKVYTVVEN